MNRKQLINFIPKPENSDIIVYDLSLSHLIDKDVFKEYYELLPIFLNKKEQYLTLESKLKEYQNSIDNIYLLKKDWTKQDYLQALQNNKKTYSTLYNDIKKIENNIEILQEKIRNIDDKIKIQLAKEQKDRENKVKNIDENITKNKDMLLNFKDKLSYHKLLLEKIESEISENNEDFEMLVKMQQQLKSGTCQCQFCGHVVKTCSEDSKLYSRLTKNFEKNKLQLEKLLANKNSMETEIAYLENEIKKIKIELNNDIEFKKQNHNLYTKKSIEILKLEALRDEMINNVSELEKQLKNNPRLNSKQYLDLKNIIDKYELSLNNLDRIEEIKKDFAQDIEKFNIIKEESKELLFKIEKYIKFISIYYKIYEQKANEYFGKEFKFKLFKFDQYALQEKFEIYYNDIEYSELSKKDKEKVEKIFYEKISFYD
jgi:chromosome segregation ATPase